MTILALAETKITVHQERDRLYIALLDRKDDSVLLDWRDDVAEDAIDDGFLSVREACLGRLDRNARQGGALHRSAYEVYRSSGVPA